jgi:hypothetical protein
MYTICVRAPRRKARRKETDGDLHCSIQSGDYGLLQRQSMTPKRDDSYKVLFFAIPFLVGGVVLLTRDTPSLLVAGATEGNGFALPTYLVAASSNMAHAAGLAGLALATLIVWFYFKIRPGSK